MIAALARIAMTSPTRQAAFRRTAILHLLLTGLITATVIRSDTLTALGIAAQVLLVVGIVEGAALIGWRLVQIPKSQALEFLLVSSLSPRSVYLAELGVGVARFLLIQLTGLPLIALLIMAGIADWHDLAVLLGMPMIWGLVAGIGLCAWIYEPKGVRRIGELLGFLSILVYLVVGVLAAENLMMWMQAMPEPYGEWLYHTIVYLNSMNPFGIVRYWFSNDSVEWIGWDRFVKLHVAACLVMILLVFRAARRLAGHFHDRHYLPIDSDRADQVAFIGERPLSWWAVRRVMEYSGRVNLYLAGGFCLAYAAYIVAGDAWPAWIGRGAFILFDSWGGPAMVATAMSVMAAVPAVYQFGLWDSSVQDRCRRLELLLLTELHASDYAHASFSAAWRRGRGYLACAAMLWIASALAHRITVLDAFAAAAGSLLLWLFAFAVGFRGFTTGHTTNGLASLITLGCPMLLYLLWTTSPAFIVLIPTATAFLPMKTGASIEWIACMTITGALTSAILWRALIHCDRDLRNWYDANQGRIVTA